MRLFLVFLLLPMTSFGQTDLNGIVMSDGNPVAFATVFFPELAVGAACDGEGQFVAADIPDGLVLIEISAVGFEKLSQTLSVQPRMDLPLVFNMKSKVTMTEVAVVSGSRTERLASDLPVKVDLLSTAGLAENRSWCLADGLCASPGLRVEKNCQTCGFSQVRMNGLPGRYTQILINGRPLFGSLIGLYGLEQIPIGLIDRIEVVRGGGSVLFGANAIAGTVNIITRKKFSPNAGFHATGSAFTGSSSANDGAVEASVDFAQKGGAGGSVFVSKSGRQALDVNRDGFSELPSLSGTTVGAFGLVPLGRNAFVRMSAFALEENRNGGDLLHLLPHERMQSEWRQTRMMAANADFTFQHPANNAESSVYVGGQLADRQHYTGVFASNGYGDTKMETIAFGAQHYRSGLRFFRTNVSLTAGAEYLVEHALDQVPAYDYYVNQTAASAAAFAQGELSFKNGNGLLGGLRVTRHNLVDHLIFTPRLAWMHRKANSTSRVSVATGFSPPSALDADLHMAFANGEVTQVLPDPNLRPENSYSLTLSHERKLEGRSLSIAPGASVFATRLLNPFILENIGAETQTIFLRTNGNGATVAGVTAEMKWKIKTRTSGDMSITFQKSRLDEAVTWSEELPGVRTFLRNPEWYGFATFKHQISERWTLGTAVTLTGPMLVPHLAGAPGVERDVLVRSPFFWDQMLKADVEVGSGRSGDWDLYFGVSNVFNAFQRDFDSGAGRDSNFIYGPAKPRHLFVGLRWNLK